MINLASVTGEYTPYAANTIVDTLGEIDPKELLNGDRNDTYNHTETYVAQPIEKPPMAEATQLVVRFQPFGSGPAAHQAVHAKIVGEAAGGVPVLTLASFPRADMFDHKDRGKIAAGDFQPYAEVYADTIRTVLKAYNRQDSIEQLGLAGYSLGAAVLPHVVDLLKDDVGKVTSVAAQSPGNIDHCTPATEQMRLGRTASADYARGIVQSSLVRHYAVALGIAEKVKDAGAKERVELIKATQGKLVQQYLLSNKALAFASGRGLAKGTFDDLFGAMLRNGSKEVDYTLGYGTSDALVPKKALDRLFKAFGDKNMSQLDIVEFNGNHAIWDDPRIIADFSCFSLRKFTAASHVAALHSAE